MTTDERVAHLREHGRGLPRAVSLGGEAAIEAWCEQQELAIDAEEAEIGDAAAREEMAEAAEDEGRSILERLDALEGAVDALAASEPTGPTEATVADVAAGGDGQEPDVEGAERFSLLAHLDEQVGALIEALQAVEGRLDAQESQGRDQWAGIEANTAARIAAHQAAKKTAKRKATGKK